MKNRILASFAALVVMLLLLPSASNAQIVNTLYSQSFPSTQAFPPSGWTFSQWTSGNPDEYGIGTYWYPSTGGNGGSGGSYGSAVAWTGGAYDYVSYGTTSVGGYYCGPLTMTTPNVSFAGYPAGDSQFVDFDLFYPEGGYMESYAQMETSVTVLSTGSNTLLTLDGGGGQQGSCNVVTGNYPPYGSDPSSYTSSGNWKHYHLPFPHGGPTTQNITFEIQQIGSATYAYWYTDNVAFTNVVITDVHYPPPLTVTGPTNINFGNVPVGQTAGPYFCDLANPNSVVIPLSNYTFGGANPGDFSLFRSPSSVPANGKDSVGITYTPHAGGARSATLTFSTGGLPATVTVQLSGAGLVPAVSYSATTMFRGVNTELTDTSRVQYLYVNSVGGAPLIITGAYFYGLDARAYFISHLPVGPIPVGGVDSIGVRFTPDIEGLPDAHMVVTSNAPNNPSDTVLMYGVGILPHLAVSSGNAVSTPPNPLKVSFDSVKLGTDSCLNITVSNPGSDTLAVEKNFFANADVDFSFTPLTGADTLIPPGGSQTIQVCFDPIQQGFRTATLRLVTNIPHEETQGALDTNTYNIVIIGVGVPTGQLMITGPATNGSTKVGKSVCVTDTFWNTGDASLTVTGVTISGANATDFDGTYNPAIPFVLAPNTHQTFQLCATPSDTGTQTGLLTGTSTSGETPGSATLNLSVYGTSVADTAIVTQAFLSESCGSDTETITVTNQGNVPTTYQASISGANAADFSVTPMTSGSEGAGGVATFTVIFTGKNSGESAMLTVNGGTALTVALSASSGSATVAGSGDAPMTFPGTVSAAFPVTINNTGSCPWTPGTLQTATNSAFVYQSGGTTPIAAGGNTTEMWTFAPTEAGSASATVNFPNQVGAASSVVVTITAAADAVQPVSAQSGYSLGQTYPNPFNDESNLEITVAAPGLVQLSIVDVQGNVVENVLNRQFDAGTYSVTLSAEGLASGTYYYQMSAGGVTLTRQMVIVK